MEKKPAHREKMVNNTNILKCDLGKETHSISVGDSVHFYYLWREKFHTIVFTKHNMATK